MHAKSGSLVGFYSEKATAGLVGTTSRVALLSVFVVLTLPVIPFLAVTVDRLKPLLLIDLSVRAVPLFITWIVDGIFVDGGEVTPHLMPLWIILTGLMLWPLLVLAVRPVFWASPRWRHGMLAYGVVMLIATIGAACWVFTHLGVFF